MFVNNRNLELPIHHGSDNSKHFRPRTGFQSILGKLALDRHSKKGLALRKRSLFGLLCVLMSLYLLLRQWGDDPIDISQYIPTFLEEREYYDFDFKELDFGALQKYDEGAASYLLSKGGRDALTSEERQQYETDMERLVASTTNMYDLSEYSGSTDGKSNRDHILVCVPLRDAAPLLPMLFKNLMNLTYPHELIDVAFLVSDCTDGGKTMTSLIELSKDLQNGTLSKSLEEFEKQQRKRNSVEDLYVRYMDKEYLANVKSAFSPPFHEGYDKPFRSIQIFEKDFGQQIGQGFSDRHAVKVQGVRRKLMGRARNWLTSNALKPYHSWVYWRDVDVELCPGTVIEDLMSHDYDVIVPNVWRPLPTFLGGAQAYDLNSWVESKEALQLAKTLDEDDVIVEGYAEYPTWRVHLGYLRKPDGNQQEVLDLDGVGGVSILARAHIFRKGIHFPAFTFENHAETEAFGKMAKKMGFKVGGLTHYTLWHIYEPSDDDLREISKLERQNRRS